MRASAIDPSTFAGRYPHIARWVQDGLVEIGWTGFGTASFVRALDEGGIVWEGTATYPSLDDALAALDAGIAAWMKRQGLT
jgi:hypothetical protein